MKKNLFLFLLFSFLFFSYSFVEGNKESYMKHLFNESPKDEMLDSDQIMGGIIDKTVREIKQKYSLFPIGVGMSGGFRGVGISFRIYRPVDKDEARVIIFDCAQKLLENINSSKEIQPYLEVKPFSLKNVGITLYSSDEEHHHFAHPNLVVAEICATGVSFHTKDKDQEFGYKEVTEETFEEARAKIAQYNAETQSRQAAK